MDVKAKTFRILYEMLIDKFDKEFSDCDHAAIIKGSEEMWRKEFKQQKPQDMEKYKIRYGKYHEEIISQMLFDLDKKATYFYLIYNNVIKRNPDTVIVKDNRLYKAIRFVNDPEPWTPERHEQQPKLTNDEINQQATILLKEFENKYVPEEEILLQETTPEEVEDDDKIEKEFLKIVTSNQAVFTPQEIDDLVSNFADHISSQEYHDAWLLLSPRAKEESLWDGRYSIFADSLQNIVNLEMNLVKNCAFRFQEVEFVLPYREEGILYDIVTPIIQAGAKKHQGHTSELTNIIDQLNNHYHSSGYDINLYEMYDEELMDYRFQKFFFSFTHKLRPLFNHFGSFTKNPTSYKMLFLTHFSCKFFENKWLIDDLGAFEPSLGKIFLRTEPLD